MNQNPCGVPRDLVPYGAGPSPLPRTVKTLAKKINPKWRVFDEPIHDFIAAVAPTAAAATRQ